MNRHATLFASTACLMLSMLCTGCVRGPRTFSSHRVPENTLCSREGQCTQDIEIVQGQPNTVIDGLGWIVGIPRKLMLWNSRVDDHSVQPETIAEVATYAEVNHLDGVCIRVNQYAPIDEWKRLTKNDRINPGWRYTMGTLSLVGYTLIPGRVFGGDNYNPYTNSVYIHSDVPALAMEATAYAKDVNSRTYPGTYAAVNQLPLVSIWHETINTKDTLDYLQSYGTYEDQKKGMEILYPNYGAAVGGAFGTVVGATPVLELGGALVGHVSGRTKSFQITAQTTDMAWLESYGDEKTKSIRMVGHDSSEVIRAQDSN